jgi:ACR3 family arsenite efflux pump ArsB
MDIVDLVLLAASAVVLLLATFDVRAHVNLIAFGLLLFVLVPLIHAVDAVN